MSILRDDNATQLAFSMHENKGVYALLLGSGVSRSAGIPTGWDITLDLVRKAATAKGEGEQTDWNEWYTDQFGQEPNYSQLLDELTTTASERRKILEGYIEPSEEEKEEGRKLPTKAHHAIAKLVSDGFVRVILTTNFDRLMEKALRDAGVEPTVITSEDTLLGADPLTHSRCYLFKLHGDYKDARILNTDDELTAYPDKYNELLDRILDEFGLVICGWSGEWDHALKAAISRAPNRRYPTYWTTRGPLIGEAQSLADLRRAKEVEIANADDFFHALQESVEAIQNSSKINPLSLELLINSTKKYIASKEQRINLDDLFAQEQQRLLAHLSDDAFEYNHKIDANELAVRISRYEACTEPLACMCGILGRWGGESEQHLVIDIIEAVMQQVERQNTGLVQLKRLGAYPAVLLLSTYCLGLVTAHKWEALHRLLLHNLKSSHQERDSKVFKLFPGAWSGGEKSVWNLLPKFSKNTKKIPFNMHLSGAIQAWSPHFVGTDPNFQILFARFELIGAFMHFVGSDLPTMEARHLANEQIEWMPLGHAVCSYDIGNALIAEFESETLIEELQMAGLSNQCRRILELFILNLKYHRRQERF